MTIEDLFFELLQISLNRRKRLSHDPTVREWESLYSLCQMQAVAGVVSNILDGLSRQGQKPPLDILYDWIGLGGQIKLQNMIVNRDVVDLCRKLQEEGFDCCILKGQGNDLLYPNPWLRNPGDIDVWMKPRGDVSDQRSDIVKIIKYVKGINPEGKVCYHHIDYGMFHGTEVEVHYRPSFMLNPIHNRRLQKWFTEHSEKQFRHEVELPDGVGKVAIPTPEFNIIFQLSHIYNHVLHEGIGLRQFVDYYYLLKSKECRVKSEKSLSEESVARDITVIQNTLKYLGLWKFAGAVMYVMREVFALEEQYMIVPVDERRGRVLLQEIMRGGNFGNYDEANIKADNRIKKNIQRIKRDIRMMRYFPSECIWEPAFRTYHFFWRMRYNR